MANLLTAKSKIVLYTSKTLKDGSHPVVLRITYDRKRKYYTLGVTGSPDRWNRDAGRFKGNNKNNKKLNKF
ncbi:MAG: Arm DNA-binding domain-containing protein [Cytophagales bacterium]|nr:Arm DNA-binding domain-containing protein [Cytophagales bacterium]